MNENAPASRGVFRTGCVLPSAHRLLRRDRLHDAREHLVQRAHAVHHRQLAVLAVELRSEEHTSELQSLMRISYAVFCLKKTNSHTAMTPNVFIEPTCITRFTTELTNTSY